MPKLIDAAPASQPIGKDGLLRFIDRMNEARAKHGTTERYRPCRRDGLLSFEPHYAFKWKDRYSPSPAYAKASAPVPHWQDRELEPA